MNLKDKRVLVIGGAGFVGSHIVDQLVREPVAEIRVFDNLVRGKLSNIQAAMPSGKVRFINGSITDVGGTAHRHGRL